jgi:hypothetical protein
MKHIFAVLLACIFLSGCAYHGALNSNAYNPQSKSEKIPATVALGEGAKVLPIRAGAPLGMEFNIETKNAVINASEKMLASAFRKLGTSCEDSQFIAEPSYKVSFVEVNTWTGRNSFDSDFCMAYYRCGVDGVFVEHCNRQRLDVYPPGSYTALAVITGLSLCVLSPITFPAMVQVTGNNAVEQGNAVIVEQINAIQTDTLRNRNKFIVPNKED